MKQEKDAARHALPRYQQIARQLTQAILSGELLPGSRLPSSRTMALEMGVARATIENAYGDLAAQGWLERRGQAGTFVSQTLSPAQPAFTTSAPPAGNREPLPFQMGLPALDAFPRALWSRLMGRRLRLQTRFDLAAPPCEGEAVLRQAIVDYLRFSRSIDCQPEQVFITAGYSMAMTLALRALAQPGEGILLEDPGFPFIRPVLAQAGLRFCPVAVDSEDMDIRQGNQRYPDARFALITPAHQSPLGVALSLPRRRELLDWAALNDRWVIEDDYDSEFRYHGKPLPPVKSLDAPQRVIYAGTFSKSLFPALRTAWLVAPPQCVAAFRQVAQHLPCTVPPLYQHTIADFIREGHFWRHLKKMRHCYGQRRQWLESALAEQGFAVTPQQGGIQLVVPVTGNDSEMASKAVKAGLAVQAISDWRMAHKGESGLLMSFTNIVSPEQARKQARALREALK